MYESIEIIYRSTDDIKNSIYSVPFDGYIQCISRSQEIAGVPFIRIYINNLLVFEDVSSSSARFKYIWSPLFQVRKNDIIKYTITTESSDGIKELRLYRNRCK